jgi:hypothetical protein
MTLMVLAMLPPIFMDIALKNKNKTCKLLQTELSWADPAF